MMRLVCLCWLLAFTGCANDRSPDPKTRYVERGRYAAGYRVMEATADLQIKTWYPAEGDGAASIEYAVVLKLPGVPPGPVPISGTAIAEAPLANSGPFPLVVLSHGFSLNPEWYHTLAEHLATHGFVVMAPEHRESDWSSDVVDATVDRPRDVAATLDFETSSALAP
jgi:predicted dienelactone hydrolase